MIFSSSLSMKRSNGFTTNSDSRTEGGVSWLYGAGAGVMVKFGDVITLPNELQRYLVDIGFRYMKGSAVDVPVIQIVDPGPAFKIEKASVDEPTFVFFNIGITAQF